MHNAALADEPSRQSLLRTSLVELTVGVQLAAPWAWCRDGVFGGLEIDDVRAFASWLGRPVRFVVLAPWEISTVLAEAEVDLVIGGIQADQKLRQVALSCHYSPRRLCHGEPRHGDQHPHVWALPRGSASLFATLAFYLWMVRKAAPRLHPVSVH